jgi:hypothetical protein
MAEIMGHKLEDWLPQELNQGPPLPEFLNIYWPWYTPPEAEIKLSNLAIAPAEVQVGSLVVVSCFAENTGTETGWRTVTLKVGGETVAEQTVALNPGESETVSFEVTPSEAKTYSVSVDGLSGTFKATEAPTADIRVENLEISPSEVPVGEKVTISVTVTNCGSVTGSKKITCTVS